MLYLTDLNMKAYIHELIEKLRLFCIDYLKTKENFKEANIETQLFLNLRYEGTDTGIMSEASSIKIAKEYAVNDFEANFLKRFKIYKK
jgi:N-methylhydantoinase A/oxoprolinase/acetone carboxylase beta subunit